jgi:lycopene cyclase domain-containing protein
MVTVFIALGVLYRGLAFKYARLLKIVVALILISIVFDNLIIIVGFVAYDPRYISGITVGRLPFEDLDYALVAAILVPLLCEYPALKRQRSTGRQTTSKDKL